MQTGTADIPKQKQVRRGLPSEGSGGGQGGRGPRGNGGGGFPPFDHMEKSFEKIRLVTWFILVIVLMTFAGLVAAYVVVSTNDVLEWNPFRLPVQIWVSTGVLLASSVTFGVSHRLRQKRRHEAAKKWLLATVALGGIFVASQLMTWIELYRAGYYLQSNPYAGFFYFITVLHALHVVGGICALGYALLKTWLPAETEDELGRRMSVSKSVGEYWHFMDALWVVLILMLGFWK